MGGQDGNDNGIQDLCVENERGAQPKHCRRQNLWCRDGQTTSNTELARYVYRIRVELIEIREFLDIRLFFFSPPVGAGAPIW